MMKIENAICGAGKKYTRRHKLGTFGSDACSESKVFTNSRMLEYVVW